MIGSEMTAYFSDKNWGSGRHEKKRIVITGIGAVTPLGNDIKTTWQSLMQGRSGIGRITLFDSSSFPVQVGAEVKGFEFCEEIPEDLRLFAGRGTMFCIHAVREALAHAGLDLEHMDTTSVGIALGANEEYMGFSVLNRLAQTTTIRNALELRRSQSDSGNPFPYLAEREPISLLWPMRKGASTAASMLSCLYNIQGPVSTTSSACASSALAIGRAMRMIQDGDAEVVITGGCDSMIAETTLAGFHRLRSLSRNNSDPEKASRPFDLKRDGFVMAEGAGMLVLEELSHARKRKAPILAELAGFGSSSNAYRITATPEDGHGIDICMLAALKDADCSLDDVDYINAHGTSTYLNDKSETAAIKSVFHERAYDIPVSSNKSMLGHSVASAAAIELIISTLTINRKMIPPTINYEYPDPECDLDYVPNVPRAKDVDAILSNSFAFGGQNASILVKKF
jgi:3-oxoacyl-[acyl-carrier-protein] synthase II